jgi:phage gpG-like protein
MTGRILGVNVDTSELMQALEGMQKRVMRLRPFYGAVGKIMLKSVHENFEQEGRPKWKGRSPLTLEAYSGAALEKAIGKGLKSNHKTSKGRASVISREYQNGISDIHGRKILQGDGELKKSVVDHVTDEYVEVGSPLVYARIHQLGGIIRPKRAPALAIPIGGGKVIKLQKVTMPARPYLHLQELDYQVMVRVAHDYLVRGEIG